MSETQEAPESKRVPSDTESDQDERTKKKEKGNPKGSPIRTDKKFAYKDKVRFEPIRTNLKFSL